MFTGIITDVGTVQLIAKRGDTTVKIATAYDPAAIAIGASIACSGPCLTVIAKGGKEGDAWFSVEASAETLSKTTLGGWAVGSRVNLERSLKVGEEIGGHIVSGHVDGVGEVVSVTPEGDSMRYKIKAPKQLAKFIAAKGSIALDGTSLTVNEVDGNTFGVNIIPHTAKATTWGGIKAGDKLNIEIDMLARYLARLKEFA
ncbi:MAG: riboflavin synthase [Alphaproteobacteria bacterium]|nr:riboflavin synthase [Alphaproteobacteria bacterium]